MKRSRIVMAGVLALGLLGSAAASATASVTPPTAGQAGPGPAGVTTVACPGLPGHPPMGTKIGTLAKAAPLGKLGNPPKIGKLEVKNGKVYLDGKQVGTAPADGQPLVVAVKDGKVYIGKAAEALPKPPLPPLPAGASGASGTSTAGGAGIVGSGPVTDQRIIIGSGGAASGRALKIQPGQGQGTHPDSVCVVSGAPGVAANDDEHAESGDQESGHEGSSHQESGDQESGHEGSSHQESGDHHED